MAAQPAKTVTVAALAGAAFAVAYKATSKYLTKNEDEPKSLDQSVLDESTASSFYGITPSSLATRHEARSMDREKSERSLRLMVESKALAQASTTDYAGGTLGSRVKLVVAMVGLPARGKSYLVKMLVRYLSWVGFPTKIFNVGELRRKQGQAGAKAEYFADTPEAMAVREGLALQCQEEMYDWLRAQKGACVAIFDATNTTRHRRHLLTERCKSESDESGNDVSIVFVESICDDPKVLNRNYEMKLQNADYRGTDPKKAMADFMERVKQYEVRSPRFEVLRCLHAIDATRVYQARSLVVSFSILSCFGPRRGRRCVSERQRSRRWRLYETAPPRRHRRDPTRVYVVIRTPSTRCLIGPSRATAMLHAGALRARRRRRGVRLHQVGQCGR